MRDSNLLLILDKNLVEKRDISKIASDLIDSGVRFIQLRDKVSSDREILNEAKSIRKAARGCVFIINDRPDIALLCGADGVHLGQDDMPYKEARRLMGRDKIIGISTHNLKEAREAQEMGADYIGVGPVFATTTKPDLRPIGLDIVECVARYIKIPAFFIGGINLSNMEEVTKRGARRVAVASAILNSDDIAAATRAMVGTLKI